MLVRRLAWSAEPKGAGARALLTIPAYGFRARRLTHLRDMSSHNFAVGHSFRSLVGLNASVEVVRSERKADLTITLAGLHRQIAS